MSFQNAPPSLEQYPGWFPADKPPFWTRTKVGVAAGVLGLLIGAAGTAVGSDIDQRSTDRGGPALLSGA